MAQKLVTSIKLTHRFIHRKVRGQTGANMLKMLTHIHFLSLTQFVHLIVKVTIVNRQSVMQSAEDCHLRLFKVVNIPYLC